MSDELNPYPGNLKQHTVLNTEGLATKIELLSNNLEGNVANWVNEDLLDIAHHIREVAQPIANELAAVKQERDELREALEQAHEAIDRLMAMLISSKAGFLPTKCGQPWEAMKTVAYLLTKYPKQDEPNETK